MDESEEMEMREVFRLVDRDHSGQIDKNELAQLLKLVNIRADEHRVQVIMDEVDDNGSGLVEWNEFLATMKRPMICKYTPNEIRQAFQILTDEDDLELPDDHVDSATLQLALRRHTKIPMETAQATVALLDPTNQGMIDYEHIIGYLSRRPTNS